MKETHKAYEETLSVISYRQRYFKDICERRVQEPKYPPYLMTHLCMFGRLKLIHDAKDECNFFVEFKDTDRDWISPIDMRFRTSNIVRMMKDEPKIHSFVQNVHLIRDTLWEHMNKEETMHMLLFYMRRFNRRCDKAFSKTMNIPSDISIASLPAHCMCIKFDIIFSRTTSTLSRTFDKNIILLIRSFCCKCRGRLMIPQCCADYPSNAK